MKVPTRAIQVWIDVHLDSVDANQCTALHIANTDEFLNIMSYLDCVEQVFIVYDITCDPETKVIYNSVLPRREQK